MSAPPYMKLYWGDYLKATRHLTTAKEHGAYFLLIGEAWRLGGALPDDDDKLAKWALCTPAEWAKLRPTILAFFDLKKGQWTHERVRKELAHYRTVSRKRKVAGKAGGSSSGGKQTENRQAIASYLLGNSPHNQNQNQRKKEDGCSGETRSRARVPEGRTAALVVLKALPADPSIPRETPAEMAARLRALS